MEQSLFAEAQQSFTWPEDQRLVKPNQLEALVKWAIGAPELVVDYETNGLKPYRGARPFMAGFFAPDKGAKVLDFRFLGGPGMVAAQDIFNGRTKGITIVQNSSFETVHTRAMFNCELGGALWDGKAAAFALDENRKPYGKFGPLSQKSLVFHNLNREPIFAKAVKQWLLTNTGQDEKFYERVPPALMVPYNAEDVTDLWDLYKHFKPMLESKGLEALVATDSELGRVVGALEERGYLLDQPFAMELLEEMGRRIKTHYSAMREVLDRDFDPGSHSALYGILHGSFELPMHDDDEKQGKLDDVVLEWLLSLTSIGPAHRKFIESLQSWRECDKIRGTYLMPWLYEHLYEGVLRPNLNPFGARTRRFSASNPNLQNVPVRTALGKQLRRCFLSRPGFTTYAADYSQIEYRGFVHYCGEPELVRGFREDPNFDIHDQVAKMVGVDRKRGKTLNFGLLFGMGKAKLKRSLLCSDAEAESILARYHARIPSIKKLKRDLERAIRGRGYIKNVFGGRRHLEPAEGYKALNSLTQGFARDLIASAMVRVYPLIRDAGGFPLMQIHDEFQFELPGLPGEHQAFIREIKRRMEDFPQIKVPIKVDIEYWTSNWLEAEEYVLHD